MCYRHDSVIRVIKVSLFTSPLEAASPFLIRYKHATNAKILAQQMLDGITYMYYISVLSVGCMKTYRTDGCFHITMIIMPLLIYIYRSRIGFMNLGCHGNQTDRELISHFYLTRDLNKKVIEWYYVL